MARYLTGRPVMPVRRPAAPGPGFIGAISAALFACWLLLLFLHPAPWSVQMVAALGGLLLGLIPGNRLIWLIVGPLVGFVPTAILVTKLYATAPMGDYFTVLAQAAALILAISAALAAVKALGRRA